MTTPQLDRLSAQCQRLHRVDAELSTLLEQAAKKDVSYADFLDDVLALELRAKQEKHRTMRVTMARFPFQKSLEMFDWKFQPSIEPKVIKELATGRFIGDAENVLLLGPPGVGKSHLACGLGVKAIKNGFSVMHVVLDDLLHALKADAAIPPARLKAKRYLNSALLLVDEVGFRPLDRMEANLFFRLVSARYERASIVVTTNKHVRDWPEVFAGDEILTTAILDRLLHHVHIVHIDGRSYRLRELDKLLTPSPTAAPPPTPSGGDAPTNPAKPVRKTG